VDDPTFDALWNQVVEDWDDDGKHGKFLAYAQQARMLGEAASRYRSAADAGSPYRLSESRLVDAQKRLAGVATLAVMDLDANKSSHVSGEHNKTVRVAAILVMLFLVGALLFLFLRY
jgi:hypothetical protein